MTAPQCEQPATTAGAAPVPMTLRAIAAWLESHPEIEPHEISLGRYGTNTATIYGLLPVSAELTSEPGHVAGVEIEAGHDLPLQREERAIRLLLALVGARERVCERIVTGTTTIEEPDPEALAAVPKVTREVETYEWRCDPILSGRVSA